MSRRAVLIVDDSMEVGRVLREGLAILGADLDVLVVPSAEEAMVEASSRTIDLLVVDIRLPGMSGFELVSRLKRKNAVLKFILITGMADPELKKQAMDAGASFFLRKPISLDVFIDAVSQCLGLGITQVQNSEEAQPQPPSDGIGQLIADLRKELDAIAVVLLDLRGQLVLKAGEPPVAGFEELMIPALIAVDSAGTKLSRLMGRSDAYGISAYHGAGYDLILAPVEDYSLVVFTRPGRSDARLLLAVGETLYAAGELLKRIPQPAEPALTQVELPVAETIKASTQETEPQEVEAALDTSKSLEELEQLFNLSQSQEIKETAEKFWDQATRKGRSTGPLNPDTLSYDQAKQLGLAPEDETQSKKEGKKSK